MLLYKNWLETRWMFLWMLALAIVPLPVLAHQISNSLPATEGIIVQTGPFWVFGAALFAGSGIRIRSGLRDRGVPGAMNYLLSLPVSRGRLFAARVVVGFLELSATIAAGVLTLWLSFPVLRESATSSAMVRYGFVILVCCSAFYFLAVLLSSLIDDEMGKTWGGILAAVILTWIGRRVGMPPSFDLWNAIVVASPSHNLIPWNALGLSASVSLVMGIAALKTVQRREYSA